MSSRMQKYYGNVEASSKRSTKNAELYKKIYEDEIYSNIEGVVATPKNNEININQVRELLLKREEEEKSKTHLVKRNIEMEIPDTSNFEDEDKNYDIMDILKQAKEDNDPSRENKYRRLDDEYLENLKNPVKKIERVPLEDDIREIKELLNTLTSSTELNRLKDTDLSLDILTDFKTNTNTLTTDDPIIKAIIDEAKELEEKQAKNADEELDNTFDTTSMKLKPKDYVDKMEQLDDDNKKSPLLIFFMVVLFVILSSLIVFIIYTILK